MSETKYLKLFKHDSPPTNKNKFDVQKALNDNWDKSDEFAGKAGAKLNLSIDPSNYIMTLQLLNINDEVIDEKTIDFPLESVVVSGRYDKGTKKVVLILQNGTEVEFPIGDLIDGLVSQSTFDTEIQKINVEIISIKGRLDTIEAEQTTQNTEIEELREENQRLREDLSNSTITASNSGENITIKDSAEARFKKLKIGGNTYQETSEFNGQYCPPVNEWELKNGAYISEDGYVMLPNENSVASIKMNWNNAAENFFVGADFKFTEEIDDNSKIYAYFDYLDNGNQELGSNGSSEKANVFSDNRYKKQIGNVQNKIKEAIYIVMRFQREKTYAPKEYGIKNVSVRTSSNYDYEEFIPNKPSPDHPSPIRNCGDNVNLIEDLEAGVYDYVSKTIINTEDLRYKSFCCEVEAGKYILSGNKKLQILRAFTDYNNSETIIFTEENKTIKNVNIYNMTITEKTKLYVSVRRADDENWSEADLLKLEKGTKATPYSPYGYGNMNFKICNENLLGLNFNNILASNCTYVRNENVINITATSAHNVALTIPLLEELPIGTYTLNSNVKLSDATIFLDNTSTTMMNYGNGYSNTSRTSKGTAFEVQFNWANTEIETQFTLDLNSAMLLEGTYTLEKLPKYIPHEEQSFSFPTKPGQVFHKGDYLADDGTHHKRKTIELDGTEDWKIYGDISTHRFYLTLHDLKIWENPSIASPNILCNQLKSVPKNHQTESNNNISINNVSKLIIIRIDETYSDVKKFTDFLKSQKENGTPIKIEYELEEEIIEPYSPEQQEVYDKIKNTAHTYKGVTHIFSEDEVSPEFEEEHLVNLEAYINSKLGVQASEPQQEVPSEMPSEEPSIEQPQLEETEVIGGEEQWI